MPCTREDFSNCQHQCCQVLRQKVFLVSILSLCPFSSLIPLYSYSKSLCTVPLLSVYFSPSRFTSLHAFLSASFLPPCRLLLLLPFRLHHCFISPNASSSKLLSTTLSARHYPTCRQVYVIILPAGCHYPHINNSCDFCCDYLVSAGDGKLDDG